MFPMGSQTSQDETRQYFMATVLPGRGERLKRLECGRNDIMLLEQSSPGDDYEGRQGQGQWGTGFCKMLHAPLDEAFGSFWRQASGRCGWHSSSESSLTRYRYVNKWTRDIYEYNREVIGTTAALRMA